MRENLVLSRVWKVFFLSLILAFFTVPVQAATIGWTQWTSITPGSPGIAKGTITLDGGKNVDVTYTGEIINTGDTGNWDQYPSTYTFAGIVDNQPSPANVSIQLNGGNSIVDTISFSTPVTNPIFAIQSLGGWDLAEYSFDESFTILAQGAGHWGGGSSSMWQSGNNLFGYEGNGILQFSGTYSSISWTVPDGEYYHMFTIGSPTSAPSVPEPATMLLLGSGLIGLAGFRKKFIKK